MDIKIISKSEDKWVFTLQKSSAAFINTLRRLILEEVPTMAIDVARIKKNDSALYDEMLAHRLGLIPLTTDLSSYTVRDNCKCGGEGCLSCEVKLTLKKVGPCNVYAKDLESADPNVVPAQPDMLITKLFEGQEVDLVGVATLGFGKNHAKHSAGYLTYKKLPKVTIKSGVKAEDLAKEISIDIFTDNKIDDAKVLVANLDNIKEYFESGILTLDESEDDFVVTVENYGCLTPDVMLKEATKSLVNKLQDLEKNL